MNEFYARDTSRKIRSVFKSKGMSGKHLTGTVIYGYLWDESGNTGLLTKKPPLWYAIFFALAMEGLRPPIRSQPSCQKKKSKCPPFTLPAMARE